jgi:hypothetical protein
LSPIGDKAYLIWPTVAAIRLRSHLGNKTRSKRASSFHLPASMLRLGSQDSGFRRYFLSHRKFQTLRKTFMSPR